MNNQPFLDAIAAAPDDDVPRLVFADYLDERGDPRGEFIRVQCELARLTSPSDRRTELRERQSDLLKQHRNLWLGPLGKVISGAVFRRGFIEDVTVVTELFLHNQDLITQVPTIRRVTFREIDRRIGDVAVSNIIGRLAFINISYNELSSRDIELFFEFANLDLVNGLNLGGNPMGDNGAVTVATTNVPSLRLLDLEGCGIGEMGVSALATSNSLGRLKTCRLYDNPIGDEGVRHLQQAKFLANSNSLDLSNTGLSDAGATVLATSRFVSHLESLTLGFNRITDIGLEHIGQSRRLTNLNHIALYGNPMTAHGLRAFLRTPVGLSITSLGVSIETVEVELAEELTARFGDRVY